MTTEPTDKPKLSDTLEFIKEWLAPGDLQRTCEKFKINSSYGSKILNGKIRRPKVEILKALKDKAQINCAKLRV